MIVSSIHPPSLIFRIRLDQPELTISFAFIFSLLSALWQIDLIGPNKSAHPDRSFHILNRMSYIIYVVVDGLVTTFLQACLILCSRDHDFTQKPSRITLDPKNIVTKRHIATYIWYGHGWLRQQRHGARKGEGYHVGRNFPWLRWG